MEERRHLLVLSMLAAVLVASAVLLWPSPSPTTATGMDSITSPDTAGGLFSSLELDGSGNPVVSYWSNTDLKVLHCNDPDCSGGDESITSPDTAGDVGRGTSLALDGNGNPVVSYYDSTNGDLKVLHCNDSDCSGGDESITSPDTGGQVGYDTSLALDTSGNPVVSYYDLGNGDLKVLHCNDPNCSGGDESITSPDTEGMVGDTISLVLDASGNPVVSYYHYTNGDLKVLHCNDPDCSGGDESITSPDTGGEVGYDPSLALDGNGNPVVSYFDLTNWDLKVMHCNDPNCAGGDESITSPDTDGQLGHRTSLVLDASGYPVVGYFDWTNRDLKVMHCNDSDCNGGDESVVSPDTGGDVGEYTSLVLDASGYPVVSYYDATNADLKLLHCGSVSCSDAKPVPEVDFALEIEGTNCTTKGGGPDVCLVPEGWQFTVNIDLNGFSNLPDDDGDTVAGYGVVEVSLDFSSGLTYAGSEMIWPDGVFCAVAAIVLPMPPYVGGCAIGIDDQASTYMGPVFAVDFSCDDTTSDQTLALLPADTKIVDEGGSALTDPAEEESLTVQCVPPGPGDTDGDGCPDADENGPDEMLGGRRNFFNPWDYFNPTNDGENRVDDIVAVLDHYYLAEGEPGYDEKYDRTYLGPNDWNLGPPNGQILVDDVLHAVNSYFHDCGEGIEKPTPTATPAP